jgi:hypothetical protein
MKSFLLALALLPLTVTAARAAELRLFVDYDPSTLHYSQKHVSTTEAPLTAGWLLQNGVAACFAGDPAEAIELLRKMVDIFNFDESVVRKEAVSPLRIVSLDSYFDEGLRAEALRAELEFSDLPDEPELYPWPRIRPCSN